MHELFELYNEKYDSLKDLLQDDMSRNLRLFNIRFRLALDIQIDFKGQISLTKSKPVRDTYVLIIRLMEAWNAYEALSHYMKETGEYGSFNKVKSRIYSKKFLTEVGSLNTLKSSLDKLKEKYKKDVRFKSDFEQYIKRIEEDERIKKTLTNDALNTLENFNENKEISGIEILSLIYAERNMYYHNGETAKLGMSYTNRKILINNYLSCLTIHTLMLVIFVLDNEINEVQ